jgi:hypothetical protein
VRRLWRAGEAGEEGLDAAAALLQDPLLRPDSSSSGSDGYSEVESSSAGGDRSSLASSGYSTEPSFKGAPGLGLAHAAAPGREASAAAAPSSGSLAAESSWLSSSGSRSGVIRAKLQVLAARRRQAVAEVSAACLACLPDSTCGSFLR